MFIVYIHINVDINKSFFIIIIIQIIISDMVFLCIKYVAILIKINMIREQFSKQHFKCKHASKTSISYFTPIYILIHTFTKYKYYLCHMSIIRIWTPNQNKFWWKTWCLHADSAHSHENFNWKIILTVIKQYFCCK